MVDNRRFWRVWNRPRVRKGGRGSGVVFGARPPLRAEPSRDALDVLWFDWFD